MKYYLKGKEIPADEAMKLITERQLEEAMMAHYNDPEEEQSYMTKQGTLVIDFKIY